MESTSIHSMEMDHANNRDAVVSSRQQRNSFSTERRQSGMSPLEEKERRASIRDIMQDPDLTPLERRQSIQSLMDGRRRSSIGDTARHSHAAAPMSMVAAAAVAAAEFYDSSDDEMMNDHPASDTRKSESTVSSSSTLMGDIPSEAAPQFPARPSRMSLSRSRSDGPLMCYATTAASTAPEEGPTVDSSRRLEQSRPPCNHYDRRCSIVSPCCGLAFGCRICHDECPILPAPILTNAENKGQATMKRRRSLPATLEPDLQHHSIDRFAVQQVICRECYTRQDGKTNKCISCGIQFGKYHCADCNLWMSDQEKPYHCDACGFCRVGGRENFRHCHDCGMCIDAQLFHDHNCKAGRYMSNCPVCQEDLFSSRSASHEMPCGHAIHWHCFKELTSYDTRCPVCKKTAETREQMASTWSAMAMSISLQPVPPEMARIVTIICNDCEERDENRQWHFLGVQCRKCSSFNTSVEQITLVGPEAADAGASPSVGQHRPGMTATAAATTGGSPGYSGVSASLQPVQRPNVSMDES